MAADSSRLWTRMSLFVIISLSLLIGVSSKQFCADSQCKEPISKARAEVVYSAQHDSYLSFPKNAEIIIYGKNAGEKHDLWIGEFGGKRGFIPPKLVRETKIMKRNLLEIQNDDEDEASNSTETNEKETNSIIDSEQVPGSERDTTPVQIDTEESNRNESANVSPSETNQKTSKSSDSVPSLNVESPYVPDAQTLSDMIKDTWISFKGTATMLSQPLESLQTLQNALTEHAGRFSDTLFKSMMVKAEEYEQGKTKGMYKVSEGTTFHDEYEYPASEVEYSQKSEDVKVASSISQLPSIGHRSTPDIPETVSGVSKTLNVSPAETQTSTSVDKEDIKPSVTKDIKPESGTTTTEVSVNYEIEEKTEKTDSDGNLEQNKVESEKVWFEDDATNPSEGSEIVETDNITDEESSFVDSAYATNEEDDEEEDEDEEDDATIDDGESELEDSEYNETSQALESDETDSKRAEDAAGINVTPKVEVDDEETNAQNDNVVDYENRGKRDVDEEANAVSDVTEQVSADSSVSDEEKSQIPVVKDEKILESVPLDEIVKENEVEKSKDAVVRDNIETGNSVDEKKKPELEFRKLSGLSVDAVHRQKLERAKLTYSNLVKSGVSEKEVQNDDDDKGSQMSETMSADTEIVDKSVSSSTVVNNVEDTINSNDIIESSGTIEEIPEQPSASEEIKPTEAVKDSSELNEDSTTHIQPSQDSSALDEILEGTDGTVKDPEVLETAKVPLHPFSFGFLSGVQSQSIVESSIASKAEQSSLENEEVMPYRHEELNEFVDSTSPKLEVVGDVSSSSTSNGDESFFPDLQIVKSVKEFVDVLRPYVQLSIDILPDFIKLYLLELEHQGVSPRVMVFTIITGIFNLLFLIAYLIVKRRSKEGRLIERLCKLDKQLFEAVTEKEVVKEELKNSKLKLSSLVGTSSDAQQTVDALTEELSESKNETRKLEEAIGFLKEQLEQQNTLVGSMRENAEMTLQKHKKLEVDHSELTDEINSLKEEKAKLSVSLEKSEVGRSQVTEELNYLQEQIVGIEQSNKQLLEEAKVWNQRVQELQQQSELYQKSTEDLQETLTLKEGELNVLQECILKLKIIQDETSDDSTETPPEKLEKLMDVTRVTAELKTISMEKNSLIERLNMEEGRSKQAEDQLAKTNSELEQLKVTKAVLQEERDAACTKLQVLSNYFKEKEIELQRELGVQEAKRQETQETAMTVTQQIASYEKDLAMYKCQIETLKKEIESQARSFKVQISQLESKAHDNWLATRAADRRSEEAKQEAAMLRNKLNLAGQEKQSDRTLGEGIVKPTPKRYAGSNGEIPSPPQLDSGPVDFLPPSGPSSLLREPLEPLPPPLPFLPQDRPLPPPPLGFPHPLPPPFLRDRMPMLPPPFDARGLAIPPFPYDMPRRMPPPPHRMMPLPNRDRYSPPSNRITPPYDPNSPPPREYRSPPPMDRWNAPASPPFDRRPPSGRRMSPPPGRAHFDTRPYMPPSGRNVRADRTPPVPPQEAHYPSTHQREPFSSTNPNKPVTDTTPKSARSGDHDETTTAV